MRIPTASEFRTSRQLEVMVPIPGTDDAFLCRRPDLQTLFFKQLIRPEQLAAATRIGDAMAAQQPMSPEDVEASSTYIDTWVSVAAVKPRVSLTEPAAGEDALFIGDLSLDLKLAILTATQPTAEVSAAVTFSAGEPAGVADRSSGEAVRATAIDPVGV